MHGSTRPHGDAPHLVSVTRALNFGLILNATSSRTAAQQSSELADAHSGSVEVDVWPTTGSMDPRALPEAHLLRNAPGETTGVCLSGGGSRAAAAAVGFLRGLTELGLVEGIDFISACSGGAYALMPFQYYSQGAANDRELLGPVIPAEKLEQETLAVVPEYSLLQRLSVPILSRFVAELVTPRCLDGSEAHEAWAFALSECFLRPFGLGDKDALVAVDDEHAHRIRTRNPQLGGAPINVRRAGRPFDIYTATLAPPTRPPTAPGAARAVIWQTEDFTPFDMTPLYCGSPLAREHAFASYSTFAGARDAARAPAAHAKAVRRYAVGGFVETFAVGGTLAPAAGSLKAPAAAVREPRLERAAQGAVNARCPLLAGRARRPMSLPRILDFTSNAYCGITNNTGAREALLQSVGLDIGGAYSRLAYWSPASAAGGAAPLAAAERLAAEPAGAPAQATTSAARAPTSSVFVSDAGGHDLAALLPMLQRSVGRVVSFLSFGVQVRTGFALDGGPSGTEWRGAEGDLDGQLPAYFGIRAQSCEHMMHSLKHVQVFKPADFWRLMAAVRAKLLEGDYPVVVMEHEVLPNAFWGIKGNYTVRMCWVLLQRVPRWEARLPDGLREQLQADCESASGEFGHFPNYPVSGQNPGHGGLDMHLTVRQAHLASQLASSYVLQQEAVFRRMLGPAGKKGPRPRGFCGPAP